MKVVVVGAGILGSSVAYHMARRGVDVEVVEACNPGSGTSASCFAYLNVIRHPRPYSMLRLEAIRYWRSLASEIGAERYVHADGSLFCPENSGDVDQLDRHAASAREIGLATEWMSRADAIDRYEPALDLPRTGEPVMRIAEEGWLEPLPVIQRLLAGAVSLGASISLGEAVQRVDDVGSKALVATDRRRIEADFVALCTGPQTQSLLQSSGVSLPIATRAGVLVVTRPSDVPLKHVVYAQKIHFKPEGAGKIIVGRTDYRITMPTPAEVSEHARLTLATLRGIVPSKPSLEVEQTRIGLRPIPGDGLPIVGHAPDAQRLFVAATHSGISLGGFIGHLAASEIVTGEPTDLLAPYRPSRFSNGTALKEEFAPWAPGDKDWDADVSEPSARLWIGPNISTRGLRMSVSRSVAHRLPPSSPTDTFPIVFENVSHRYSGDKPALQNLSFKIEGAGFTAIIGPSGAGKSTTLRIINGLVEPSDGVVNVGGLDLRRAGGKHIRQTRRRIGMIFQQFNLVERLSALENVLLGRLGYRSFFQSDLGTAGRHDREMAFALLERVGIADHAWNRADRLSGGQKQRVGIARALAQEPKVILADEPISALDPRTAIDILDLLTSIAETDSIGVIANLHALDAVADYAERAIGLRLGRLVFDGPPSHLGKDQINLIFGGPKATAPRGPLLHQTAPHRSCLTTETGTLQQRTST